jgi:hypothetical protein
MWSLVEMQMAWKFLLLLTKKNSWRPRVNRIVSKIAFFWEVLVQMSIFTMDMDGNDVKQVTNTVPISGFNLMKSILE